MKNFAYIKLEIKIISTVWLFLFSLACNKEEQPVVNSGSDQPTDTDVCRQFAPSYPQFDLNVTFPRWQSSPYRLPYHVGETYQVGQGNSTNGSHVASWSYSYDFVMNIGTEILAIRGGTVIHAIDGTADGDRGGMNLISIKHTDGSVALYLHLTLNGVLVEEGQRVKQGELIGLSGDSGNTNGVPHLHLSVHSCSEFPPGPPGMPPSGSCATLPITFRNTNENPNGLGSGLCYEAFEG